MLSCKFQAREIDREKFSWLSMCQNHKKGSGANTNNNNKIVLLKKMKIIYQIIKLQVETSHHTAPPNKPQTLKT